MDKKPLNSLWLQNDKGEDRTKTESVVRNNVFLLTRLREIIDHKIAELERMEMTPTVYDNPSWAYKQAHINGVSQALNDIKKLTDFL